MKTRIAGTTTPVLGLTLGGGGLLFLTQCTASDAGGFVAFAALLPGTIRELSIDPSDQFMVTTAKLAAAIEPYLPDKSSSTSN